jgi:TRAP-type C4-dicarboxylate transport system substrate-binding protein
MKKTVQLLATGALMALATGATAEQYRATTWLGQGINLTQKFFYEWADDVAERSGGDITFEIFPGGSLVPAQSIQQGVADGIVQVGYHTAAYTPTANPVSQALSGMGFLNSDPYVLSLAYADFVMNDPIGYNDWRANGVIPLGGFSSPPFILICGDDAVRSLSDMENKRVRLPGGFVASFVESLGAVNVSMPITDVYAAFQYGNIDCTAVDAPWLAGQGRLAEVAGSVTTLEMTPLFTSPPYIYDVEFWESLDVAQRRMMFEATAQAMANLQNDYAVAVAAGFENARDKGLDIIEPDDTLLSARTEWIEAGMGDMLGLASSTYGIEDPQNVFDTFEGYMEKWEELLKSVEDRTDTEAMQAFIMANLFDKIDAETYGLE